MIEKIIKKLKYTYGKTLLNNISKDPFKILISTILSSRTKNETTYLVTKKLFQKYKTKEQLAKASLKEIESTIKSSGFYKQKAKYIKQTSTLLLNGQVPSTIEELIKFPGVGNKVASCVLVYAFNKPTIPVDIHVARISNRIDLTREINPNKIQEDLKAKIPKKYWILINDLFVTHGKTICLPRKPLCHKCSINKYCNYFKALK